MRTGMDAVLLPACLLLAFGSALVVAYGHTDDYSMLFLQQLGWRQMNVDWFIASGRPFLAFLNDRLLQRVDSVDGLVTLRFVGFILLLWLGWLIRRLLLVSRLPRHEATLVALACVLTPAAAVFVGWAITSVSMLAGVAAMLSFAFVERSRQAWSACRRVGVSACGWEALRAASWLVLAVGFLLTAFLIYQPLAPLFLLAVLIRFAFDRNAGRGERQLLVMLVGYIAVMGLYLALYKLVMVPAQAGNAGAIERGGLDLSPLVVTEHLIQALPMLSGGWEFFRSGIHPESLPWPVRWTVTMLVVVWLLPVGLWRIAGAADGGTLRRLRRIALIAVVWLVSLLPMLILRDHYLPTRTLFFSYAAVCVLVYLGLKTLTQDQVWPHWATTGFALVLAAQAGLGFWDGMVRVQAREFAALRDAIAAMPERPARLAFIQPCDGFGPDHRLPSHHEYFIYSSHHDWIPQPLVNLLWNQREGIGRGRADETRLRYTEVERVRPGQPLPDGYDAVLDAQALLCGVPGR